MSTRSEAQKRGSKRYFTGAPCKHGHVAERVTSSGACIECRQTIHYDKHKKSISNRKYYEENREYFAEYYTEYFLANKVDYVVRAAKRRATVKNATPGWSDNKAIKEIYKEAERLTLTTGIIHHVDHQIPLQHDNVCGLHVVDNLQILTQTENCSKSNSW